jgi:hypothetical protein
MNHAMNNPGFVFDVVAVVCFAVAAIPWPAPVNLVALGLVFFTLGHMF